ncbi:protein FAM83B [Chiloscyllium plagiosum]|uniref:protein FAM83B n=1 Tax=Chiloscyllium plagiosum TaxID=36176 RepID=UPI001CB8027D|nr:protein FAM83B [Chiloscyllium plagiosum]XP_043535298.1 protein FAM83B [Chiloscyllium plagiosum]XP_043535309.1 protein FAM83B [Chiloscyllium plagiosum]XP_043535318.1 protein FAM83B [Chiloscyllium plagiosum]
MNLSSHISSLGEEFRSEDYVEPHYKEWYRVAIDTLADEGIPAYEQFLAKEGLSEFLAEEEICLIKDNVQKLAPSIATYYLDDSKDGSSSGTYWPVQSDTDAPDLDLGWPYVIKGLETQTKIDLYFHPPRDNSPTIKEIVRKLIKNGKQVIAIVMDIFTDVDIFKEVLEAAARGVPVYIVLDDSNFKHFTMMCEKQGVQLQRLMNIRIRTVKGLDYLCRSGSKFHGKMTEKFLLVDCKTAVYGTYSFMWSFEKINLSMVQVITGHLVESYDEEFRTLYARSDIPAIFSPESSRLLVDRKQPSMWQHHQNTNIYQHSLASFASSSSQYQPLSRQNPKRHTLDTLYQKLHSRQNTHLNERNNTDNKFNSRNAHIRPHIANGLDATNRVSRLQTYERNDYWKRHSYAGEQPETSSYLLMNRPANQRPLFQRSDQNLLEESESVTSSTRGEFMSTTIKNALDRLKHKRITPNFERSSNIRNTYHGPKTLNLPSTYKLPTLENMKRTGLRNWRIESYLNDKAGPAVNSSTESFDGTDLNTTDRFENPAGPKMHENLELINRTEIKTNPNLSNSRLRSSLVFKTSMMGQADVFSPNSESTTSTISANSGSTTPREQTSSNLKYSWMIADKQRSSDEVKTPSVAGIQQLSSYSRSSQNETEVNQRPNQHNQSFQAHQTDQNKASDYTAGQESGHYTLPKTKFHSSSARTLSIHSLTDTKGNESPKIWHFGKGKKNPEHPTNFLTRSSEKIKSLLSLSSDKRDNQPRSRGSVASYKTNSSTDTLTSESDQRERRKIAKYAQNEQTEKTPSTSSNSVNTPKFDHADKQEPLNTDGYLLAKGDTRLGDASAPRFTTEQLDIGNTEHKSRASPSSLVRKLKPEESKNNIYTTTTTQPKEHRVYSRFEKVYMPQTSNLKLERTEPTSVPAKPVDSNNTFLSEQSHRQSRFPSYQGNHVRQATHHNENKFEKFMHRFVGSFKSKK